MALGQLDVWFLIRMFGNTGFGFCLDDWIFLVFLDCRFFGFSVIGLLDIVRKFIQETKDLFKGIGWFLVFQDGWFFSPFVFRLTF